MPVRIAHISDLHVARPPPADSDEKVEYAEAFLVRALPVAAASVALTALSRPEIRSAVLGFLDNSKAESASRDVDPSKIVVGLGLALGLAAAGAWFWRRELMELWQSLGPADPGAQGRLVILQSLRQLEVDHLVITGDLTNIASDAEFEAARAYVDQLRSAVPAGSVCILPGNHDVQTSTGEVGGPCLDRFHRHFGDLLPRNGGQYPLSWQLGEASLVGLNSCTEGVGFGTRGRLGSDQLARLNEHLASLKPGPRIVGLHHHLRKKGLEPGMPPLEDAAELLSICDRHDVSWILHGHKHEPYRHSVGKIEVRCAGSTPQIQAKNAAHTGVQWIELGTVETQQNRAPAERPLEGK